MAHLQTQRERLSRVARPIQMRYVLKFVDSYMTKNKSKRLREEWAQRNGWCRLHVLLQLPTLAVWATQGVALKALRESGRYHVKKEVRETDGKTQFLIKLKKFNAQGKIVYEAGDEEPLDGRQLDANDIRLYRSYRCNDREVVLLRTEKQVKKKLAKACEWLARSSALGLAVEYVPLQSLKNKGATDDGQVTNNTDPAVLQLASDDLTLVVWLHKLSNHGKELLASPEAQPLLALLQSQTIQKVGVDVEQHIHNLSQWWNVNEDDDNDQSLLVSGLVDVRNMTRSLHAHDSLQDVTARILIRYLPVWRPRTATEASTNWRSPGLDNRRLVYAAQNAAASLDIYKCLLNQREEEDDVNQHFDNMNESEFVSSAMNGGEEEEEDADLVSQHLEDVMNETESVSSVSSAMEREENAGDETIEHEQYKDTSESDVLSNAIDENKGISDSVDQQFEDIINTDSELVTSDTYREKEGGHSVNHQVDSEVKPSPNESDDVLTAANNADFEHSATSYADDVLTTETNNVDDALTKTVQVDDVQLPKSTTAAIQ
jgi:hypothetical protein